MKLSLFTRIVIVAAAALSLSQARTAVAQTSWLITRDYRSVTLEVDKAVLEGKRDVTFATSIWFLSGRLPLKRNAFFVVEVPYSRYRERLTGPCADGPGSCPEIVYTQNMIGNPYFGVENITLGNSMFAEIGFRMPVAEESKDIASSFSSVVEFERFEAFSRNLFTMKGAIGIRSQQSREFTIVAAIGPTAMTSSKAEYDWSETFVDYRFTFLLQRQNVKFGAGITGRMLLTEPDIDFSDRFVHHLGFAGEVKLGRVHLGAHLKRPLDEDLTKIIGFVYGLQTSIEIGPNSVH